MSERKLATIQEIGLKTVPMLPKFLMKNQTVDSMVELSRFKSSLIDMDAEGKVYRVLDEGGFVVDSFKVINPDFLVKNGNWYNERMRNETNANK